MPIRSKKLSDDKKPLLRDLKDGKGFWLPNELVDLYGRSLGAKGIEIYIRLCRAVTVEHYPGIESLAEMCRVTKPKLYAYLEQMLSFELINMHDLEAIQAGL